MKRRWTCLDFITFDWTNRLLLTRRLLDAGAHAMEQVRGWRVARGRPAPQESWLTAL